MEVEGIRWPSTSAMVRDSAERFAAKVAVEDGDVVWTFSDLRGEVDHAARALVASGVGVGDSVAIWAPNIHEWIPAALGVHAVGAVLVPLNTRYKGREAAYILAKSQARLLFTVNGFLDTDYVGMLADADTKMAHLEEVVVLRGSDDVEGPSGIAVTPWEEFLGRGFDDLQSDVNARIEALAPHDLCDIMFTSGTTGRPKGVLSTHGQSLRAFETWSRLVGLRDDDRYLVVNPFFHTFGYKAGILASVMRGATLLPHAVFDAEQVLRRIEADRVSMLPGPPALYQTILNHPDRSSMDLSSLRLAVTGAAAIPVSLIERMRGELGFETVLTAYGLTEATGVVSMCRDGDDAETIATTSGRAIPDVEVRIVDESGAEVPRGEPGEIVVRGYNVTQGYLDDPEATAEAIVDGWLHTGDIGVMDERGYVDITDRKKDMFIVGGFNAYPAEIENDLGEHPAIAQVAVVGMSDERLGEVGCAFVVPAVGATVDPDEVIAWARDRMANFKVPRRVEVVDALPTNPSGKILKYALRERLNA